MQDPVVTAEPITMNAAAVPSGHFSTCRLAMGPAQLVRETIRDSKSLVCLLAGPAHCTRPVPGSVAT